MSHNHGPFYTKEESIINAVAFMDRDWIKVKEIVIDETSFRALAIEKGLRVTEDQPVITLAGHCGWIKVKHDRS